MVDIERRTGADRRNRPHGPWYKRLDTRASLILLVVWISLCLLAFIALNVSRDVRLNQRIVNRQLHQRDRTCLIVRAQDIPDPDGLCSQMLIDQENNER